MGEKRWNALRWGLLGCGGIVLLCMLLGWLNALCAKPTERGFKIEDLLIDETAFPPGWKASVTGPVPPSNDPVGGQTSIERTSLNFYKLDGVALQEIHRYTNIRAAVREFNRIIPFEFPESRHWSPWERPEGFLYQGFYADHVRIGCARKTWEGVSIEFCRMVGQYEEYVVRFSTKISPEYMTYLDFERIVQAIDERMGHYLGKRPVRPTP